MIELAASFNPLEWIKNTFFGGIITDVNYLLFAFKLVVLLFIITFVKNRFGGGMVATIAALVIAYVALFTDYFLFFGPIVFVYLFIAFGFISFLYDLAIVKPWANRQQEEESGAERRKMGNSETQMKKFMGMK